MYSNNGYGDFAIGKSGAGLTISYYGSSWPLTAISDVLLEFQVPAFGTIFSVLVIFQTTTSGSITGFNAPLVAQPAVLMIPFAKR